MCDSVCCNACCNVCCNVCCMCVVLQQEYRVSKTYRMPQVAGLFPQKSHQLQGSFSDKTSKDNASYVSSPSCSATRYTECILLLKCGTLVTHIATHTVPRTYNTCCNTCCNTHWYPKENSATRYAKCSIMARYHTSRLMFHMASELSCQN